MEAMRQTWSDDRLDLLNQRVEDGFRQVEVSFRLIDSRFEQIDRRFEQIDRRFEVVDQRLDRIDTRLDRLEDGQVQVNETLAAMQRSHAQQTLAVVVTSIVGFTGIVVALASGAG
jgi:septation ring formation regulator EzrA